MDEIAKGIGYVAMASAVVYPLAIGFGLLSGWLIDKFNGP